jgi:hypothetical protein
MTSQTDDIALIDREARDVATRIMRVLTTLPDPALRTRVLRAVAARELAPHDARRAR